MYMKPSITELEESWQSKNSKINTKTERRLLNKEKYKFCRKPNVNKIKLFDHLHNVEVMNYPEVKEYAKENA